MCAFAAVAGVERGEGVRRGAGRKRWWEKRGEAVFQEAGRVPDGLGLARQVRGKSARDLGGRGIAGEPVLYSRGEALDVTGGKKEPRVGHPKPGQEISGGAGHGR
ncbi:hypothetical protein [Streptomyces sp. NBC_01180]|uniref:hypothetical protein n=1 Tax=Streptomyces sp. NBC_01180 TaxID=2903763 RepID=UPI00386C3284|nr:hypothetical protein OG708_13195 [Streptomyces sp. NBC_01180]